MNSQNSRQTLKRRLCNRWVVASSSWKADCLKVWWNKQLHFQTFWLWVVVVMCVWRVFFFLLFSLSSFQMIYFTGKWCELLQIVSFFFVCFILFFKDLFIFVYQGTGLALLFTSLFFYFVIFCFYFETHLSQMCIEK